MSYTKKTTRRIEGEDDNGHYEQIPAIDEALQMLIMLTTGETSFSGIVMTHWNNGGLRTPSVDWCKKARKKIIEVPMLEVIGVPEFTGTALFSMNNGELSGLPEVINK